MKKESGDERRAKSKRTQFAYPQPLKDRAATNGWVWGRKITTAKLQVLLVKKQQQCRFERQTDIPSFGRSLQRTQEAEYYDGFLGI